MRGHVAAPRFSRRATSDNANLSCALRADTATATPTGSGRAAGADHTPLSARSGAGQAGCRMRVLTPERSLPESRANRRSRFLRSSRRRASRRQTYVVIPSRPALRSGGRVASFRLRIRTARGRPFAPRDSVAPECSWLDERRARTPRGRRPRRRPSRGDGRARPPDGGGRAAARRASPATRVLRADRGPSRPRRLG